MTHSHRRKLNVGDKAWFQKLLVYIVERLHSGWYIVKDEAGNFYKAQIDELYKVRKKPVPHLNGITAQRKNQEELKAIRDSYVARGLWKT